MKKKLLIVSALFLILTLVAIVSLSQSTPTNTGPSDSTETTTPEGIVLYYGIGCPFCEEIDEYLEEKNTADYVTYEQKEVYYNMENAYELATAAAACGFPTDQIGVPFLWDGEGCFIGMPDIVNFFNQQVSSINNE